MTDGFPALLLDAQRRAQRAPHLALLAISLDGVPASHNRMRGRPRAFEQMRGKLERVRAAGLPFGFIFTLTRDNLDELAWVSELACTEGAKLLQIHPLEQVDRARDYLLRPPDDLELSFALLEVARQQQQYRDRLTLQFDVADRQLIAREPCRAFAGPAPAAEQAMDSPLVALVSPLVEQEDGWVVPIRHGYGTAHAIAHLDHGTFQAQAARWKRQRHADLVELAQRVLSDIGQTPQHLPFTNWYAVITTASAQRRPTRALAASVHLTAA